jgi:hypothetical protein
MTDTVTFAFLQRELNLFATAGQTPVQVWGFGITATAMLMHRVLGTIKNKQPQLLTSTAANTAERQIAGIDNVLVQIAHIFGALGVQNEYIRGRAEELLNQLVNENKGGRSTDKVMSHLSALTETLLARLSSSNAVLAQQADLVTRLVTIAQFVGCDCDSGIPQNLLSKALVDHIQSLLSSRVGNVRRVESVVTEKTPVIVAQTPLPVTSERVVVTSVRPLAASSFAPPPSRPSASQQVVLIDEDFGPDIEDKVQALEASLQQALSESAEHTQRIAALTQSNVWQDLQLQEAIQQLTAATTTLDRQSDLVLELSHIVQFDIVLKSEVSVQHLLSQQLIQHIHQQWQGLQRSTEDANRALAIRLAELAALQEHSTSQAQTIINQTALLASTEEAFASQAQYVEQLLELLELPIAVSSEQPLLRMEILNAIKDKLRVQQQQLDRMAAELSNKDLLSQEQTGTLQMQIQVLLEKLHTINTLLQQHADFVHNVEEVTHFDRDHSTQAVEGVQSKLLEHITKLLKELQLKNDNLSETVQTQEREIRELEKIQAAKDHQHQLQSEELAISTHLLDQETAMVIRLEEIVDFPVTQPREHPHLLSEPLLVFIDNQWNQLQEGRSTEALQLSNQLSSLQSKTKQLQDDIDRQVQERKELVNTNELTASELRAEQQHSMTLQQSLSEKSKVITELEEQLSELSTQSEQSTQLFTEKLHNVTSALEITTDKLSTVQAFHQHSIKEKDDEIAERVAELNATRDEASAIVREQSELVQLLCEVVKFDPSQLSDADLTPLLTPELIEHVRELLESLKRTTPHRTRISQKVPNSTASMNTDGDNSTVRETPAQDYEFDENGEDIWSDQQPNDYLGDLSPASHGMIRDDDMDSNYSMSMSTHPLPTSNGYVAEGSSEYVHGKLDERNSPTSSNITYPTDNTRVTSLSSKSSPMREKGGSLTPTRSQIKKTRSTSSRDDSPPSNRIPYYKTESNSSRDHHKHHREGNPHNHAPAPLNVPDFPQDDGDYSAMVVDFGSSYNDAILGSHAGRFSSEDYCKNFGEATSHDRKDDELFRLVALQSELPPDTYNN